MDKKGNKIILITGIILLCVILFVIYYFFFGSLSRDGIKYNNPKKLVNGYVESLINKDYKESIKYIYLPDNSFVNRKDFEEYIKTKDYYNDIGDMEISSINSDGSNDFDVILKDKSGGTVEINISCVERTINDYRIDESDIYLKDYLFSVPLGTTVYIDDYEVSKELIAKKTSDQEYYLLPAIAKSEKTFKLVHKLSTKEIVVTPVESNDSYKISIELNNDELKDKAYSFIKSSWNNMWTSYYNKKSIDSVMKYFDEKYTESDVKTYYSKSFKNIRTGLTTIGEFKSYKINNIVDNPNEPSLILNDELIRVNFGYSLNWKWKYLGADSAVRMSMNRYSTLVLKIKDDSFVIYDIPDVGLFNYANRYTRDF